MSSRDVRTTGDWSGRCVIIPQHISESPATNNKKPQTAGAPGTSPCSTSARKKCRATIGRHQHRICEPDNSNRLSVTSVACAPMHSPYPHHRRRHRRHRRHHRRHHHAVARQNLFVKRSCKKNNKSGRGLYKGRRTKGSRRTWWFERLVRVLQLTRTRDHSRESRMRRRCPRRGRACASWWPSVSCRPACQSSPVFDVME